MILEGYEAPRDDVRAVTDWRGEAHATVRRRTPHYPPSL